MAKTSKLSSNEVLRHNRKYRLLITDYSLSTGFSSASFKTIIILLASVLFLCVYLTARAHYAYSQSVERYLVKQPPIFLSEHHHPQPLHVHEAFSSNGTSLVAACHNNHEVLRSSFMSWIAVAGIDEIILVDWSSSPPLHYVIEELDIPQKTSLPAITIVLVQNESVWIPSRAFNVAFRLARASRVLRIDCDHYVRNDFLKKHTLDNEIFFTGRKELARTKDELYLRNILYIDRKTFASVGGYDERIQSYGGEHEDLVRRLLKKDLRRNDLDYNVFEYFVRKESGIYPAPEGAFGALIGASSQYAANLQSVEISINLKMASSLPVWNWTSTDDAVFENDRNLNITVPSFRHPNVNYVMLNNSRKVMDLRSNMSSLLLKTYIREAIVDILSTQYRIPACLVSPLQLDEQKALLKTFSHAAEKRSIGLPRALFVFLTGELSSRLTLLGSALSFASQTHRLAIVYWFPLTKTDKRMTSLYSLFTEQSDLTIIEDLLEKQDSFPRHCLKNGGAAPVQYFTFLSNREKQSVIVEENSTPHIAVEGDTRIHSDVLHLSNDKTIRSHILSLEPRPEISSRLRLLQDLHISRAVGIYVPTSHDRQTNNSELMESYSIVHAHLASIARERNQFEVYIDADELFRSKLQLQKFSLLPQISLQPDFDGPDRNGTYFKRDLTRILALTRTASFFSTREDQFTHIVKILRGDNI